MHLTKSDFKVARTCPTKLYYKKLRYPSLMEDNPYLEFLADGGYMVETMAKLLFPDGVEIGNWDKPVEAFAQSRDAILTGDGTFFEPTILHGKFLARLDILRREGRILKLIEVKSTSFDSRADAGHPFRGARGTILSEWRPYLEDVTFQKMVLQRAFPDFTVVPCLCIVDKARTATGNSTFDKFHLRRDQNPEGAFRPEVEYTGDAASLATDHVLAILNVSADVEELEAEVTRAAEEFANSIGSEGIQKIAPVIGKMCKQCEYRLGPSVTHKNGFAECWGNLAHPDPHILDLYRVDLVGGKNTDAVSLLAAEGRTGLLDAPREMLTGAAAARQRLQLICTERNEESIAPGLTRELRGHPYPLHFIDFEASRLAIPYHVGMHPYELAAFQWSCHTMRNPGGPLEHAEWLNDQDAFPNFDFVRSLRSQIGDEGTVYIWSPYERTVLREIRTQMDPYGQTDPDLASWIDRFVYDPNPRVVDLCDLARQHYFHPRMKGSVSIKYVLPSVWEANPALHQQPEFAGYARIGHDGRAMNPYDVLPPLPIADKEEVVKEGTGAMRVYQEMMFGRSSADLKIRQQYRQLLLQYCQLDTAAMAIIWKHWQQ